MKRGIRMTTTLKHEFTFMGRTVQIIERPNALHAKYTAHIDGVSVGVNFHLASSAAEDAKREVERQDAEKRRLTSPQWKLPPSDGDFAAANEDGERYDLCA